MTRDILNDKVQERFEILKRKMNLNIRETIKERPIELTQEKLDNMLNPKHILTKDELKLSNSVAGLSEAVDEADKVQEVFDFIETLELPPQLSLAIGLIISAHKTNDNQDIVKAVVALGEYING